MPLARRARSSGKRPRIEASRSRARCASSAARRGRACTPAAMPMPCPVKPAQIARWCSASSQPTSGRPSRAKPMVPAQRCSIATPSGTSSREPVLDRALDRLGRLVLVADLAVEIEVAPAADHEPAVGQSAASTDSPSARRSGRGDDLARERRGREHLAAARRDQRRRAPGTAAARRRWCASTSVRARAMPPSSARLPQRRRSSARRATGECAKSRAPRFAAARASPCRKRTGCELAVLGRRRTRRRSARAACAGHRVRDRDLAHREAVGLEQRQRGAQVLGLLVGARQAQAAGRAVVAVDAERLDELAHALVGAPADLEHRARAGAAPQRDLLGVGLGGRDHAGSRRCARWPRRRSRRPRAARPWRPARPACRRA